MRHISGSTMRLVLSALREATGIQFERLMREAKLERFVSELPADGMSPACTDQELSALFGALHKVFGGAMTRHVLVDYGKAVPAGLFASPMGQQLKAEVAKLPPAQFMDWWAQAMPRLLTAVWANAAVADGGATWRVTLEGCPTCASIRGARAPVCVNTSIIYSGVATMLAGRPIQIAETECVAAGAPACVFEFAKAQ